MKNVKILIISIVLAIISVVMVFSYVKNREKTLLDMGTEVQVAVAVDNIAAGTRLNESNVALQSIPKRYLQPDAITDIESLYDQIVGISVLENTQILQAMLTTPESAGLAQKIPTNKMAYSVSVNKVTGVAGLLQPGDFVDVQLTVEVGNYDSNESVVDHEIITSVILHKIQVLAVEQKTQKTFISPGSAMTNNGPGTIFQLQDSQQNVAGPGSNNIGTVTLAVLPEDSVKLNLAQEIGTIALALRSASYDDIIYDDKMNNYELLGIDKPVLKKSLPAWVEIRGAEQITRY